MKETSSSTTPPQKTITNFAFVMAVNVKVYFIVILALVLECCTGDSNTPEQGTKWAVLVAGSSGYENYRHQADVCHAYHILRDHGVPAENIITMMYDDIAYNKENPRPGVVINAVNGSNLYEGIIRDYIGKDVNSTNFLKVLVGDEEGMRGIGSGKVLKSGPNDHVFINFVDHGANGLICFPNYTDVLYAPDLLKVFMQMSDKQMFGKMLVYIEACESGSLFDKFLSEHMNIFAVTAAKRGEDSYACCWDESVGAYLGDVFSINWMDDSDYENLQEETIAKQYYVVVSETNTSHPQEFGSLLIGGMQVGQFLGMRDYRKYSSKVTSQCNDAVRSSDVPIAILQRKLEIAEDSAERDDLNSKINSLFKLRRSVDRIMKEILTLVFEHVGQQPIKEVLQRKSVLTEENYPCYKKITSHWFTNCYGHSTSPYSLRKLPVFANICVHYSELGESVINAMNTICPHIEVRKGIY